MSELLSLTAAVEAVLARARPLGSERVALADAAGRVLAEPVRAEVDLPPFPASAMDGYAVRAAEAPGTFPIVFRIAAGLPAPRALATGEAMAIATGGAVPEGADAVVPIEVVREEGDALVVPGAVEPGANVRPRGGDIAQGAEVVPAGARLGAAQIGAIGAAGLREVTCARRPRVAIVTTGSELRPPGSQLGPGEIYESNGAMLAAQLEAAGAEVQTPAVAADDDDAHREAIESGLELDVLVTSGGVSVGPHDLVRRIEGELGSRGGVLGRGGEARKAGLVRCSRERRSCSACPATRSRRSSRVRFSSRLRSRPCRARLTPGPGSSGDGLLRTCAATRTATSCSAPLRAPARTAYRSRPFWDRRAT